MTFPGAAYLKRKKGRWKCKKHRVWLEDAQGEITTEGVRLAVGEEVRVACWECISEAGRVEDAKDEETLEIVEEEEEEFAGVEFEDTPYGLIRTGGFPRWVH